MSSLPDKVQQAQAALTMMSAVIVTVTGVAQCISWCTAKCEDYNPEKLRLDLSNAMHLVVDDSALLEGHLTALIEQCASIRRNDIAKEKVRMFEVLAGDIETISGSNDAVHREVAHHLTRPLFERYYNVVNICRKLRKHQGIVQQLHTRVKTMSDQTVREALLLKASSRAPHFDATGHAHQSSTSLGNHRSTTEDRTSTFYRRGVRHAVDMPHELGEGIVPESGDLEAALFTDLPRYNSSRTSLAGRSATSLQMPRAASSPSTNAPAPDSHSAEGEARLSQTTAYQRKFSRSVSHNGEENEIRTLSPTENPWQECDSRPEASDIRGNPSGSNQNFNYVDRRGALPPHQQFVDDPKTYFKGLTIHAGNSEDSSHRRNPYDEFTNSVSLRNRDGRPYTQTRGEARSTQHNELQTDPRRPPHPYTKQRDREPVQSSGPPPGARSSHEELPPTRTQHSDAQSSRGVSRSKDVQTLGLPARAAANYLPGPSGHAESSNSVTVRRAPQRGNSAPTLKRFHDLGDPAHDAYDFGDRKKE